MSAETLAVIRVREREAIESSRMVLRGLIGYAAQSALEVFIQRLESGRIPDGVLPIAVGILVDKHRQAEGEPTQVIEVKRTATLDQVKKELGFLRLGKDVVEAEMSDAEPTDPASRVSKETRRAGPAGEEEAR